MRRWRIAVLMPDNEIRASFFNREAKQELEAFADIFWNTGKKHYAPEELKRAISGMDAVITGWGCPALTEENLEGNYDLKVLAHTGGTVAHIASPAVYQKRIRVLSGNNVYAASVAEGAMAYMLLALRCLPDYIEEMREKGWRQDNYWNQGLIGAEVGIVGFGAIAEQLVFLLKPFGVHLKICSKHKSAEELEALGAEKVELEEIFGCRVVSLHGAGGSGLKIGKELLNKMPEHSVLINTARGDLLDEKALAQVLKERPTLRAVLDVFEEEPLAAESPLRQLRNVYLIPHMAGPTIDRRPLVIKSLIRDLQALQKGREAKLEITEERASFMSR